MYLGRDYLPTSCIARSLSRYMVWWDLTVAVFTSFTSYSHIHTHTHKGKPEPRQMATTKKKKKNSSSSTFGIPKKKKSKKQKKSLRRESRVRKKAPKVREPDQLGQQATNQKVTNSTADFSLCSRTANDILPQTALAAAAATTTTTAVEDASHSTRSLARCC
ncbi:uncharacterized protein K452DRAFT_71349 [Aplosporella prunicola CBS 121167]|uniref:Uncharacterized protein n=1 Tax=Aplosporella prunicola CBS 121167 TaxID=1176127 RepID=A0A6A6BVE2_9PEZI|nr:uncharacterized protein K452DRAFT_71349 [Aplosporella prunicola CBS 121167]KAF2146817.1 hypothetical protein K452DRAFT_71349 [Aplosporella prunicola CBS 121167]